jgi:hypothetical protein
MLSDLSVERWGEPWVGMEVNWDSNRAGGNYSFIHLHKYETTRRREGEGEQVRGK